MQLGSPPWFVIGCYSRCRTSHRGRLSPWQCGACLVSLSVPQPASGSLPCILKHICFSVGAFIAPLVLERAHFLFHTFFSFLIFILVFLNALLPFSLPHVISRMGKSDTVDISLFCLVAMDFYRHQIDEELDRRAFQSVFEMVASPGSPYYQLLCCLQSIHQDTSL